MAYFNQYLFLIKWWYSSTLIWNIKNKNNIIYLTFDDGPVPEVTEYVLGILDEYNIKATFFCVGENIVKHPNIFAKIIEKQHAIGNHTFNHLKGWQCTAHDYISNIDKAQAAIISNGASAKLFRPPYGKATRSQLAEISQTHQIIMWDVLTGDYDATQSGEDCLQEALKYTQSGSIIVFHDSYKAAKNLKYALPRFIEASIKNGYNFAKL